MSPAERRLLLHRSLLGRYFLPDCSTPSESQLLQIAVNQGSQSESHGKLFWTIHNIMASHQMDVPMPKGSHLVLNVNDKDVSSQCAIKVCWTRGSREYTLNTAKVTENSDSYHWTTSRLAECMLLLQADLAYQVGRRPWAAQQALSYAAVSSVSVVLDIFHKKKCPIKGKPCQGAVISRRIF